MRTSRKMHAVGSRNLYQAVRVHGKMQSLRFFTTILSINLSDAVPYCKLVHRFAYDSCYREPGLHAFVCSAMMADAFVAMTSLCTLMLGVPDGFAKGYIDAMHSAHMCDYFPCNGHFCGKFSSESLGTLQHLQIAGDVNLVDFLVGRTVRSLVVQTFLCSEDVDTLADVVVRRDSGAYHSLRHLRLSVYTFDILEVFGHLKLLDSVFPLLTELRFGTPNLNALVSPSFLCQILSKIKLCELAYLALAIRKYGRF